MSLESLMTATQRLSASMDALAALGAELRLRQEGTFAAPPVRQLLQEAVQQIDPQLLAAITPDEESAALTIIEAQFLQAIDLLKNPARSPIWSHDDPTILNGQGLTSRRFVRAFEMLGSQNESLNAALHRPGTFLDVGTGTGWLAIEVARSWSTWNVVGLDRFEPALRLARANVAASGLADRIELRPQPLERLDDVDKFTLAWLPGAFLAPQIVMGALERTFRSLVHGGWIVFGLFSPPPGPGGTALDALKVTRNGGHLWQESDVEQRLQACGFIQVGSISMTGTTFVTGQRPLH